MSGRLYALIVGIDRYSPAGRVPALRGCAADAQAIRAWLVEQLHVPVERILLLQDEAATRQAIIDGWRHHLHDQAGPGDQVFFHYSGHGSQARSSDPQEVDGLDETVIAHDSRDPDHYDLLDKELALLIGEVEARGAQVTLLIDCCHSGHITRTVDERRPLARQSPPDLRLRPPETILRAEPQAQTRAGAAPVDNHLLLAACRDEELANEYRDPVGASWHGALTYAFLKTLRQSPAGRTWGEIYDRVYAEVRTLYPSQSPQLEGPQNLQLFGGAAETSAYALIVQEVQGTAAVKVNGGAAVGLTAGSRLALYPPASDLTGRALATATVDEVAVDSSWANLERPRVIEPGSRVRILAQGYSGQQALVATTDALVRQEINTLRDGASSTFLRIIDATDPAPSPDFYVGATADSFVIQDAAGEPLLVERPPRTPAGAKQVAHNLEQLAIYFNILRLRNQAFEPALRDALAVVEVAPTQQAESGWVGKAGQGISFRLHNQSRQALYVAVLHMNSGYGIQRIYPDRGAMDKLAPGYKTLPIRATATLPNPAQTRGREIFKIFVTAVAMSFDALQLPALNRAADLTSTGVRDSSPLGWLLDAVRNTGTRPIRPLDDSSDDEWFVAQLEFDVTR